MQLASNSATPGPDVRAGTLGPGDIPVGTPLAWPVTDMDGTLLLDRGVVVINQAERDFLFQQFTPVRGDLTEMAAADAAIANTRQSASRPGPQRLEDMQLSIGTQVGVRAGAASRGPIYPGRVIGFVPSEALFITSPRVDGQVLPLMVGENVEIVSIGSQAVFRFVCTVVAVCQFPFDYVILSKPGSIKRLRERRSVRVRVRFPVQYATGEKTGSYDGVGLAQSIGVYDMTLATAWALGEVGDRVQLAFRLKSPDFDIRIETGATIRSVNKGGESGEPTAHGLEFDQMETVKQMAIKAFILDRLDDAPLAG